MKVKLPRSVAEAIEHYSNPSVGYTKYGVIQCIVCESDPIALTARRELIERFDEGACWDVLMTALISGYEVEDTPEGKIADWFKDLQCQIDAGINGDYKEKVIIEQTTITDVLRILNIRIEGVNA